MIVGDPRIFAIESEISFAYERLSFRALGYFVIHLKSMIYGVRSPDATMLACSYDEVEKRLRLRGKHVAPFSKHVDAGAIADAVVQSIYGREEGQQWFGQADTAFAPSLHENDIGWAPDGDEAFDDGSHVVQFDCDDRARVIAFKSNAECRHIPDTLTDVWMSAEAYYGVLDQWRAAFEIEWTKTSKTAEF